MFYPVADNVWRHGVRGGKRACGCDITPRGRKNRIGESGTGGFSPKSRTRRDSLLHRYCITPQSVLQYAKWLFLCTKLRDGLYALYTAAGYRRLPFLPLYQASLLTSSFLGWYNSDRGIRTLTFGDRKRKTAASDAESAGHARNAIRYCRRKAGCGPRGRDCRSGIEIFGAGMNLCRSYERNHCCKLQR